MAQKRIIEPQLSPMFRTSPSTHFQKRYWKWRMALLILKVSTLSILLVSMVSAIASATGNALQIRIKGGWTSSPIFYIILVGRPGLGKTPPLDFAYRPIRAYDFQNLSKFRAMIEKAQNEKGSSTSAFWPRCIKYQAEQNYGVGLYTRSIDASPQCQSTRYRCFCR